MVVNHWLTKCQILNSFFFLCPMIEIKETTMSRKTSLSSANEMLFHMHQHKLGCMTMIYVYTSLIWWPFYHIEAESSMFRLADDYLQSFHQMHPGNGIFCPIGNTLKQRKLEAAGTAVAIARSTPWLRPAKDFCSKSKDRISHVLLKTNTWSGYKRTGRLM